jgi:hypothetical protein
LPSRLAAKRMVSPSAEKSGASSLEGLFVRLTEVPSGLTTKISLLPVLLVWKM